MTDHGFRTISIGSIVIDVADIRARMARPDVIELALSRKKIALHPVTVDARTNRLIAGRDRMAADLINRAQKVNARFVEGSAEELLDIEDDENIRRRHGDRDQAIARKVNRAKGELSVDLTGNSVRQTEEVRKVGRPKTDEGKAREEVAKAAATTPEAVRSAVKRTKPAPEQTSVAPPIALHGKDVPIEFLAEVRAVQQVIDAADAHGRAMHGILSKLADERFPAALLQRLQRDVHAATAAVRAARPRSKCKQCDTGCPTCNGCGWVAEEFEVSKPADVPVLAVSSERRLPASVRNAKKIAIEMPNGVAYTPPAQDDDVPF